MAVSYQRQTDLSGANISELISLIVYNRDLIVPSGEPVWKQFIQEFSNIFIGERPPDFPSFWKRLHLLRPADREHIACTNCYSRSGRVLIRANMQSICDHFRAFHLDTRIKIIDISVNEHRIRSVIDSLAKKPKYDEIIQRVLNCCRELPEFVDPIELAVSRKVAQYSKEKLPDVHILSQQLRLNNHGMLACQRTTCTKMSPFSADRASIVEHIWRNHCPHLQQLAQSYGYEIRKDILSALEGDTTFFLIDDLLARAEVINPLANLNDRRREIDKHGHRRLSLSAYTNLRNSDQ